MAQIKSIFSQKIIDSKANAAIETTVILSDGTIETSSVAAVPVGDTYEAVELKDTGTEMGIRKAVDTINSLIASKLTNLDASLQKIIDRTLIELDGTENKTKLGANSMLSVSQAVLKAAAKSSHIPMAHYIQNLLSTEHATQKIPLPLFTIYEGGTHVTNTRSNFQEFILVPASSKSFSESVELGMDVYQHVQKLLKERNASSLITDEGGYSVGQLTNKEVLQDLKTAIDRTTHKFSLDVFLGIDAAANAFHNRTMYTIKDRPEPYAFKELVEYYKKLQSEFSLLYIEDPFHEEDWEGWKSIFTELSSKVLIVSDALTATNPYRLQVAMNNGVINGMVIKPVQIGTITEAIAVAEIARFKDLKIIVSERTSDTEDTFIADFAVGIGADYVKFGAPVRERAAKYNRILDIQKELEKK